MRIDINETECCPLCWGNGWIYSGPDGDDREGCPIPHGPRHIDDPLPGEQLPPVDDTDGILNPFEI